MSQVGVWAGNSLLLAPNDRGQQGRKKAQAKQESWLPGRLDEEKNVGMLDMRAQRRTGTGLKLDRDSAWTGNKTKVVLSRWQGKRGEVSRKQTKIKCIFLSFFQHLFLNQQALIIAPDLSSGKGLSLHFFSHIIHYRITLVPHARSSGQHNCSARLLTLSLM